MKINLTDAEWKLMNLLWENAPRTIMELTADMREDTGWSKNTIITMLSRLEAKGVVRYESGGRARRYFPSVNQEDAALEETKNFLGKVYGGSLGLMINAMVLNRAVSPEELEELRQILDRAEEETS